MDKVIKDLMDFTVEYLDAAASCSVLYDDGQILLLKASMPITGR